MYPHFEDKTQYENFVSNLSFSLKDDVFKTLSNSIKAFIGKEDYSLFGFGCGTANKELSIIRNLKTKPREIILIDKSQHMLDKAKKKLTAKKYGSLITTYCADFTDENYFPDNQNSYTLKKVATMFGGTLGNIDYIKFLTNLKNIYSRSFFFGDLAKHSQDLYFENKSIEEYFNERSKSNGYQIGFTSKIDYQNSKNGLYGTYRVQIHQSNNTSYEFISITTFSFSYLQSILRNIGFQNIKIIEDKYDIAFLLRKARKYYN